MAEGFYNFLTNSRNATSAGVEDFAQKYSFRPTPEIVAAMAEKGINISTQRIKVLTPQICKDVDQIVVLCNPALCPDYLLQNTKTILREVPDPFRQDRNLVRQIRDEIEIIVKGLL